jgi:HEAT repeat protein
MPSDAVDSANCERPFTEPARLASGRSPRFEAPRVPGGLGVVSHVPARLFRGATSTRLRLGSSRLRLMCLLVGWQCLLPGCGDSEFDQLLSAARGEDLEQQRLALRQIADMGARASAAVPHLILLTSHENADVRRLAGLGLGNIVADVRGDAPEIDQSGILAALSRQLEDKDTGVRHSAAFALLGLDADHQAAQECLLVAMRRGDGGIIDRLKSMQPPPTWAVPPLIEILMRDRRPGIRRLAAVSLGTIAPDQPDVRGALQRALRDADDRVRDAAQRALDGERLGT